MPGLRFRDYRSQLHRIIQDIQLSFLSIRQDRNILLLSSRSPISKFPASALDPGIKVSKRYRINLVLRCLYSNLKLSILNLPLLLKDKCAVVIIVLKDGAHLGIGETEKLLHLG